LTKQKQPCTGSGRPSDSTTSRTASTRRFNPSTSFVLSRPAISSFSSPKIGLRTSILPL
jgi:hypothetical protein